MKPNVKAFFDPATWTVSYVVFDRLGGRAAIEGGLVVDPRLGRVVRRPVRRSAGS